MRLGHATRDGRKTLTRQSTMWLMPTIGLTRSACVMSRTSGNGILVHGKHMGLFSRLFGSHKSTEVHCHHSAQDCRPKSVPNRQPGDRLLNLRGVAGEETMKLDRRILQPIFGEVRESCGDVPQCARVLFLYTDFDSAGKDYWPAHRLREIIKAAGAYIAVVASGNCPINYMKCPALRDTTRPANITSLSQQR